MTWYAFDTEEKTHDLLYSAPTLKDLKAWTSDILDGYPITVRKGAVPTMRFLNTVDGSVALAMNRDDANGWGFDYSQVPRYPSRAVPKYRLTDDDIHAVSLVRAGGQLQPRYGGHVPIILGLRALSFSAPFIARSLATSTPFVKRVIEQPGVFLYVTER